MERRNRNANVGRAEMELRLTIFDSIREPGRRYTQAEIAAACGVSRATIWAMERCALRKLRQAAERRKLEEAA